MKKLFTLIIAIFCAVAINAQVTGSGNGFAETFTYENGYTFVEGQYGEVGAEWPEGSVIEDGKLKWDVGAEGEGWFGMWEIDMDLSENTEITLKYQLPADGDFGIWVENADGGGEIWPDLMKGLTEMQSYTFDLSTYVYFETETPLDLSKNIIEIWIGSYSAAGGTFYIDDLVIGDGSLTGIEMKKVSNLSVYPNPVSSEFSIGDNAESVSIFNITGQKVISLQNYEKGALIDISELKEGIYLVVADKRTSKLMVR